MDQQQKLHPICDCMTASEGRVVGTMVHDVEPRQGNVNRLLSGTAIQATNSYWNCRNRTASEASIHLQGPDSGYKPSQLGGQNLSSEKMTVCRTNTTQGSVAQVEGVSGNKLNKIRKPYMRKNVQVPETQRTAPFNPECKIRRSRAANNVHLRPYRDRVIHLLALRDYKKPELFLRLKKDGIFKKDKNSLGKTLQQVATLNPKNFSYTLKDYFFKEIQRDWPGYTESDRQVLESVLAKKAELAQNAAATNRLESSRGSNTDTVRPQKQPFNFNVVDPFGKRKIRISRLTTRTQSVANAELCYTSGKPAAGLSPPPAAAASPASPTPSSASLPISDSPQPLSSPYSSCSSPERPKTPDLHDDNSCQNSSTFEQQQSEPTSLQVLASISIHMQYPRPTEKNPSTSEKFQYQIIQHQAKNLKCTIKVIKTPTSQDRGGKSYSSEERCSTPGSSDYLTNYFAIVTSEQRQQYAEEFRAEFDEYQALRAKMVNLSRGFVNLDAKRKKLSSRTKEYQDVSEQISLGYEKMKQSNPNFEAEKERCHYLYNKLSHIKRLIKDFDQKQAESWH